MTFFRLDVPNLGIWKLGISQACLPIPSCHFTTLIQNWSINFLNFVDISLKLALRSKICRLAQPLSKCVYQRQTQIGEGPERINTKSAVENALSASIKGLSKYFFENHTKELQLCLNGTLSRREVEWGAIAWRVWNSHIVKTARQFGTYHKAH